MKSKSNTHPVEDSLLPAFVVRKILLMNSPRIIHHSRQGSYYLLRLRRPKRDPSASTYSPATMLTRKLRGKHTLCKPALQQRSRRQPHPLRMVPLPPKPKRCRSSSPSFWKQREARRSFPRPPAEMRRSLQQRIALSPAHGAASCFRDRPADLLRVGQGTAVLEARAGAWCSSFGAIFRSPGR